MGPAQQFAGKLHIKHVVRKRNRGSVSKCVCARVWVCECKCSQDEGFCLSCIYSQSNHKFDKKKHTNFRFFYF